MERQLKMINDKLIFWWATRGLLHFLLFCSCHHCASADLTTENDTMQQARLAAKPWFVRNIEVAGVHLPMSYATLVIAILTCIYVYGWIIGPTNTSFCEASHILLEDQSEETMATMETWKKTIGNNGIMFAQYAKEKSKCPSKRKGGRLGKFPRHQMAEPFDRACFNPESPVGTALGPIQTQFGIHLIFIHDRKIS